MSIPFEFRAKHYENTPIQIYWKFHHQKKSFQMKILIFFHIAQNIDCGYSLEPPQQGSSIEYPQSMFLSRKATHIFSAKNIRLLYIESTKTVNEMTLNKLVKLTTLWTTGPWTLYPLTILILVFEEVHLTAVEMSINCLMNNKQCWPWSDAMFCGIWSWTSQFAETYLSECLG